MIRKYTLIAVLAGVFILPGCGLFKSKNFDLDRIIKVRPDNEDLLFDYADILKDEREYSNRYLSMMKKDYFIEAIIVSVPSLDDKWRIEDLAVEIFENWKIGQKYDGRGILLLLADKEKKIKLEVSKELEDVFTDALSGYIEDKQLRPYFTAKQIGLGLISTMEEMEKRAQIKHQGKYTLADIERLDNEFLTSGAGAKRDLTKYENFEVKKSDSKCPAGATPDESWQTMIKSWKDRVNDNNLEIYTEVTKLAYRDYKNMSNSYYDEQVRNYSGKDYEVIQNNDYAVIFFGNKKGWDNSPFLFARTDEGWKFDIVYQRKYIRMGRSPDWGVELNNYPYIDLLDKCPYWMGQDIPLEGDDVYKISEDLQIAEKIKSLEQKIKSSPNNFDVVMELGYLYTKIAFGQKAKPLLKKAKTLNPDSSLPYKCLAIVQVDTTYQYNSAIQELEEYVRREPEDVFGHNYLGYLYYQVNQYEKAIKHFEKAIKLRLDNSYAYCKSSRCYAQLYLNVSDFDIRKGSYKDKASGMFFSAQSLTTPDARRVNWLKRWLREKEIIN